MQWQDICIYLCQAFCHNLYSDAMLKMLTSQVCTKFTSYILMKSICTILVIFFYLSFFFITSNTLLGNFCVFSFQGSWITLMELLPAFSLYRIVYEFSRFEWHGRYMVFSGIQWIHMTNPENGLAGVLTIMVLEWFVFLLFTFYLDHFRSFKDGMRKAAVFVRSPINGNHFETAQQQNIQLQEFRASIEMERTDVIREVCSALFFGTLQSVPYSSRSPFFLCFFFGERASRVCWDN